MATTTTIAYTTSTFTPQQTGAPLAWVCVRSASFDAVKIMEHSLPRRPDVAGAAPHVIQLATPWLPSAVVGASFLGLTAVMTVAEQHWPTGSVQLLLPCLHQLLCRDRGATRINFHPGSDVEAGAKGDCKTPDPIGYAAYTRTCQPCIPTRRVGHPGAHSPGTWERPCCKHACPNRCSDPT